MGELYDLFEKVRTILCVPGRRISPRGGRLLARSIPSSTRLRSMRVTRTIISRMTLRNNLQRRYLQ